ncbi:Aminotransferase [Sulfidibacter corallicola]|uniref:Aminotransferase n=1 Tax=Sulfidibacter corallicola TaxID=2818388 RepID=A0A8A4TTS8_SULCO|nr:aminotransferase class I/II-fold pyridoxal phosphate-dependent enzyme [Sulfidibacter corallicola]QTD52777.1 aminotransferase class I/II-fold pyridoxal phosphate-dependent enzyme [Sulfidibacter corallicola]
MSAPQRHINLNVRNLSLSATLGINERSAQLSREGRKIFRLGLGQSPFPVPDPVIAALRENAHERDYLPVKGLSTLRDAVATYHRERGMAVEGEDILIGPGSKELMFLLQLVYYGDLVIPTPSWVSYAPQAHIIGRNVRWIKTHAHNAWRLTPEELAQFCQSDPDCPRLVILNYPANPTGATYSVDELKAIAEVAHQYGIVLLSDEIYGELNHRGEHVSIAEFYPEGTIVSNGLSKWCGAGGWRLGTFAFPRSLRWLLDAMAVVASETFTSTSAPIQFAAIRAFQGGAEIERYLRASRAVLGALGDMYYRILHKAGVHVAKPAGGFYLFPDFSPFQDALARRGITTSVQFCEALLQETGVAILPGSAFGRPPNELTARIAYVDFDGAEALGKVVDDERGARLTKKAVDRIGADLNESARRIRDFLRRSGVP